MTAIDRTEALSMAEVALSRASVELCRATRYQVMAAQTRGDRAALLDAARQALDRAEEFLTVAAAYQEVARSLPLSTNTNKEGSSCLP